MTGVIPNGQGADLARTRLENLASDERVTTIILVVAGIVLSLTTSYSLLGYSRDYLEYLNYYNTIPRILSFEDARFEPEFHAAAWLFSVVFDADMSLFILAISAISIGIKFYLFKRYLSYPLIAALLYMVTFYPIHEYTQYRVGIALSFAYLAAHLLLERKYFKSSACLIVSIGFHYSSILVALTAVGGFLGYGRRGVLIAIAGLAIGGLLILQFPQVLTSVFETLNPLSSNYLDNKAMYEGVSLLSVNNLILIAAILAYIMAGYYNSGRYETMFLIMTIVCLFPIILLPEAPIIAQRSKEVLFLAVIFLSCYNPLSKSNIFGFGFVAAMSALLGYLHVSGGVIFT